MMRHIYTALLTLMLCMAGAAQAQNLADDIALSRPDGVMINLIEKVEGPNGDKYFLYSEPGERFVCESPRSGSVTRTNKSQTMWNLSVVLAKESPKNITENNRTSIMWDGRGNVLRIQLPTVSELAALRQGHGGLPENWRLNCIFDSRPMLQGRAEFWTATPKWGDHSTYSLETGQTNDRGDADHWAVALKVLTIDPLRVCLFEHREYDGAYRCLNAGDTRWFGDMNDRLSSIIVGKDCSARLYEHGDYGGRSAIYNERRKSAEPWFRLTGMNDAASSMKIRCGADSVVEASEVCLFEHADMAGNVVCHGTGTWDPTATYPDGSPANDTFSSLVVGKNCDVTLYDDINFGGAGVNYSARSKGTNLKVSDLAEFNDRTSSIKVNCN